MKHQTSTSKEINGFLEFEIHLIRFDLSHRENVNKGFLLNLFSNFKRMLRNITETIVLALEESCKYFVKLEFNAESLQLSPSRSLKSIHGIPNQFVANLLVYSVLQHRADNHLLGTLRANHFQPLHPLQHSH